MRPPAPVVGGNQTGVHWLDLLMVQSSREKRLEFTVLGDTVNVANRLEQATKIHDLPLIASADTVNVAGEDLAMLLACLALRHDLA